MTEPTDADVPSRLVAAAERHPNRIALRAGDETLSYAALRQRAEAVAGRLRAQHGVGPGALVGLVPARNAAWIVGLLPVGLGGVMTLLQPSHMAILIEEPLGRLLVVGAAALQLVGIVIVRRIAAIDY